MFLGKAKLDTIKFLISKLLINLNTNHDGFVSVNNVLKEYNYMKGVTSARLCWCFAK